MFQSPRKRLPAVDYVSIVKSLYADRRSMLYGVLAAALAAGAAGMRAESPYLMAIAAAFVVAGLVRNLDMKAFESVRLVPDDVVTANHWEVRAMIGGAVIAGLHGLWCLVSLVFVADDFAAYSSTAVTVAALVGIVTRNFALDRLVMLQTLLVAAPLGLGIFLHGDPYYGFLSLLVLIFLASLGRLAGNVREIFFGAVHGRVDASRLALELDTALSTMPLGLCMLDETGRIAVVNRQAKERVLGMRPGRWVGRMFSSVIAEAEREGTLSKEAAEQLLRSVAAAGKQTKIVLTAVDSSQVEVTIATQQGRTVLMFEDITERVKAQERIHYMAHYDGLTSLPNRSHFTQQVETWLERLASGEGGAVELMMIDIDDFKHVNDTWGHPVGDELLKEAARRVKAAVGESGLIARFGGDEFTLFRAGGASEAVARRDADAILASLRAPFHLTGRTLSVHASIGVVVGDAGDGLAVLLTRADLALYKAKGGGKAQWCLFEEEMDIDYRQRQRLKAELPEALSAGTLSLVYQPIVDLKTRQIVGCEALTRWPHPELGRISPMVFIPIAEEIGAISVLSRWVLLTAAAECARWPSHLKVSVNLSATDFRTADVAEMVTAALDATGLAPERLEVEITESILIEEQDAVVEALTKLRRRGVGVALDDFGTGYSSLSYLHALPFTKLKIDRSFVVDVTTSARSQKLVSNIARLSKDLDMTVTVEGIETEEQLAEISKSREIDQAQGYLFGAPLPQADVAELIARVAQDAPRRIRA